MTAVTRKLLTRNVDNHDPGQPVDHGTRPSGRGQIEREDCEWVTIDALRPWRGIGAALLAQVEASARQAGCRKLWLVTTNDNVDTVRFYQRRGFRLAAIHTDAMTRSRALKPTIPWVGMHGIPIRHELELSKPL